MYWLSVALYLALAAPHLDSPGLNIDEGSDGLVASYILKPPPLSPPPVMNHSIVVFGKTFPVQAEAYVGAVLHYLIFPFLKIFGSGTLALRIPCLLLGCLSLAFLYGFCRRAFGPRVAAWAGLLTATNPNFVQFSRVAFHREEMLAVTFFLAALFFYFEFLREKKSGALVVAFLALGLGLSAKLIFLWYLPALAVACLFFPGVFRVGEWNSRHVILACGAFSAGALFLILFNFHNDWFTLRLMWARLFHHEPAPGFYKGGIDNLRYLSNLGVRLNQCLWLFSGRIESRMDWGVLAPRWLDYLGVLFGVYTGLAIIVSSWVRKGLFLYVIYGVVLLLSPFSLTSLNPGHMAMLLPFPQMAMGLFLESMRERRPRGTILAAFTGLLLLLQSGTNLFYSAEMHRSGGVGRWSTAINETAAFLSERGIVSPIIFDYGFQENIAFLTELRVMPVLCYGPVESVEAFYRRIYTAPQKPLYYLWMPPSGPKSESAARRDAFLKLSRGEGRKENLLKVFFNREQRPVYWLYELSKDQS